jgi:hypothetical protein
MRAGMVHFPLDLCSPDKVNVGSCKLLDLRYFFQSVILGRVYVVM